MNPLRGTTAVMICATALALGGCRAYAPRPLEPDARYAAFLERSAADAEVAAFAASLNERGVKVAFDPADGLSLEEAEVVALVFNPELRLARLRAGVARVTAETAGLWEDPALGVDAARVIESAPRPWILMGSLGFTLPISGRLEAEKLRAGAEHAAEIARVAEREWRVVSGLREAWLEWAAAEQRCRVLSELVGRVESLVRIVDAKEREGEMARLESSLFRIELATRRAELLRAQNAERERRQRVHQVMGLPAGADAPLIASWGGDIGEDDVLAAARRRSPSLAVALAEYEVAERRLALETRRQFPDVGLMPGAGSDMGMEQVTLGVSLPLPLWNRNRQGIGVAEMEREVAAGAFDAAVESLHADVRAALVRLAAARADRMTLEEEIVPLVEEQFAAARAVAELGEVDVLLLLETLTRRQEAKLAIVEARLAEALATARLRALVGPEARGAAADPGKAVMR